MRRGYNCSMPLQCRENTALDFEAEIEFLREHEREMNNKLFVYGLLKRGYDLDLENYGGKFIGEAHIKGATLYGIGRRNGGREFGRWEEVKHEFCGVGLRLSREGEFTVAHGELWGVPSTLWNWLDGIEQNGFMYTRKIVEVSVKDEEGHLDGVHAWVYEHTYPDFKYEHPLLNGVF